MAEAQNPKKFWKLLYFFFLMCEAYAGIASAVTLISGGNIPMGVATIITSVVALVLTIKLFK